MSVLIFKYQVRQILYCNFLLHILADQRHAFMEKIFMFFKVLLVFFFHFLNFLPHLKSSWQQQQKTPQFRLLVRSNYFSLLVVNLGEKVKVWLSTLGFWSIVALWDLNVELNSVSSPCVLFPSLSPLALNTQSSYCGWERQKTGNSLIWRKVHHGCLSIYLP